MRIFLSSTYRDLVDIRSAAINYLKDIVGHTKDATGEVVAMEYFDATERTCKAECLHELSKCDLVIGIYGELYGSVDEETGLSMTEIEFDYAVEHDIPVLAFVMRTHHREDDENKFIHEKVYAQGKSCANFEHKADFIDRLDSSLKNYLGTFDGYSINSLWGEVNELAKAISTKLSDEEKADLQMEPYISGQESLALEHILHGVSCIEALLSPFHLLADAVFDYSYTHDCYPNKITRRDRKQLIKNIESISADIRGIKETLYIGFPNHITHIRLATSFLQLKEVQHRLLSEHWTENLRKEVVQIREKYLSTIETSYHVD